jgi:tRNA threonylcarbamoyladenosine biosynthesis protein TsaE
MTLRLTSHSAKDTQAIAAEVARVVQAGDLVVLGGDLGAGKTTFTQGLGAALGVEDLITSPTFVLMRTYEGRGLPVVHLDVYRLEHLQEAVDLGLAEILDDGAVAVVEWGDLVAAVLPADFLEILIEQPHDDDAPDDDRHLALRAVGPRWSARMRVLGEALAPWAASHAAPEGDTAC